MLKGILISIFGEDLVYPPSYTRENYDLYDKLNASPNIKLENKIYIGHTWVWYSKKISNLIDNFPNKKIILIRDPRDYVVSQAHFIEDRITVNNGYPRPIDKRFSQLPRWEDKLSAAIIGLGGKDKGGFLDPVNEVFDKCIQWLRLAPNSLLIRFEDIIGPQFGGKMDRVATTIRSIIEFIGCSVGDSEDLLNDIYRGSDPKSLRSLIQSYKLHIVDHWNCQHKLE